MSKELWECPKCKWKYEAPLPCQEIIHACNPKSSKRQKLQKIREAA